MKKMWLGIINSLIMILIVVLVIVQTSSEHQRVLNNEIDNFKSTTIRMNNVQNFK